MKLIVAHCKNGGIGKDNNLPWQIRSDLIKFSKLTRGNGNNAIIMGKNTWLSLPKRPLPKRDNLILSSSLSKDLRLAFLSENTPEIPDNVKIFNNIKDLLEFSREKYKEIWVIGGASIYKEFLERNLIKEIYISYIDKDFDCDVFFPEISEADWNIETSTHVIKEGEEYNFAIYDKKYTHRRLCVADILDSENAKVEKEVDIDTGVETSYICAICDRFFINILGENRDSYDSFLENIRQKYIRKPEHEEFFRHFQESTEYMSFDDRFECNVCKNMVCLGCTSKSYNYKLRLDYVIDPNSQETPNVIISIPVEKNGKKIPIDCPFCRAPLI